MGGERSATMATEEEQISLACPGRDCRGDRIEWWRGAEMVEGAHKSTGWPLGPAEWTCNYCGRPVIRPSSLQEALDRLPTADSPKLKAFIRTALHSE
jgi:hypothetical protein